MKKRKSSICLFMIIVLICINIPVTNLFASSVGETQNTINSDYIMIVNTNQDPNNRQETGVINFDNSAQDKVSIEKNNTIEKVIEEIKQPQKEVTANRLTNQVYKTYQIGDKYIDYNNGKNYECIGIGTQCYIWMEVNLKSTYDTAGKTIQVANDMIQVYQGKPSEFLLNIAGGELPTADSSGKLSIFLEQTDASGYFGGESDITTIHINMVEGSRYTTSVASSKDGLLVHEGQHALFLNFVGQNDRSLTHEYSWINEGLSVANMEYLWGGDDPTGWLSKIEGNVDLRNGSALIYADYRDSTALDYSMPFLFVRYLSHRLIGSYQPDELTKVIYQVSAKGKNSKQWIEEILKRKGDNATFEEVLCDFYAAIAEQDLTGNRGFHGDSIVYQNIKNYPIYKGGSGESVSIPGTGAILIKTINGTFTKPTNAGADIQFIAVRRNTNLLKPKIGQGTEESPYSIQNEIELAALEQYPEAKFKLNNDITITGNNFYTIKEFSGTLDGNGYRIIELDRPLIANNKGTIKNLEINANIDGEYKNNFGIITNINEGTITDCTVKGRVDIHLTGTSFIFNQNVGMIAGDNSYYAHITRCNSDIQTQVTILANNANIGGLVGYQKGGFVDNSYTTGRLNVIQSSGGNYQTNIGGVIGKIEAFSSAPIIENVYSVTDITANINSQNSKNVGQILGNVNAQIPIHNIISVYGKKGVRAIGISNFTSEEVSLMEKTIEELKQPTTYQNWKFGSVWKLNPYPEFITKEDITDITVTIQKDYFIGEELSLYGATLNVNGSSIKLTKDLLEQLDSSTEGKKIVNGKYLGKEFSFEVNVQKPTSVTNLSCSHEPKLTYIEGEKFNPEGMVLLAYINGQPYQTVLYSGFTYNKIETLTQADKNITFQYGNATLTMPLQVNKKVAKSVNIIQKMEKTLYTEKEAMDFAGLKVQITYDNGTTSEIFGVADFQKQDVHIGWYKENKMQTYTIGTALTKEHSEAAFYLFIGEVSDSNAVNKYFGQIKVEQKMIMPEMTFRFGLGIEHYYFSEEIKGGSGGEYSARLKSGTIPSGIKIQWSWNCFMIDGITYTKENSKLVYEITDKGTGEKIEAIINIIVTEPLADAYFTKFSFLASQNNGLKEDIIGKLDENKNVLLTVPSDTDVSNMQITYELCEGATIDNMNQWNGARIDFTNPVSFEITAENGEKKTRIVTVKKEAQEVQKSSNNNLKSISGITLKESFSKTKLNYTATVSYTTQNVKVTGIAEDSKAIVTVIGGSNLKVGNNTITIKVIAENGRGKTYTIVVTRQAAPKSGNNNLKAISGITLKESFSKTRLNYTATVSYTTQNVKIRGIAEDSKATVTVIGGSNLKVGNNTVTIKVTAENGNNKTYTIEIRRKSEKEYVGNINSELQVFNLAKNSKGNHYVNGKIIVVEWVNGKSTVPKVKPQMRFKSTDGRVNMDVFVTPTGTNTYYFDRFIEGIDTSKQYYFEIASGDRNNVSQNRSMNVYFTASKFNNKSIGAYRNDKIMLSGQNIKFVKNTYIGNINSELQVFNLAKDPKGNHYVNGKIIVVEWVNGRSTVPKTKPKMRFKSTDGKVNMDVFVTPTGTNTYYFDRFIEGIDTSKQYYFEIASGDNNNVSKNKSMNVYFTADKFNNKSIGNYRNKKLMLKNTQIVFK